MGRTLAEKVWDAHVVRRAEGEPDLLYIDLHLVHEVTSPQAFDGLRLAGRPVRRPGSDARHRGPQRPDRTARLLDRPIPSPTRCRAPRSRRCARTARSSASGCTRWATRARASCTSSARSSGLTQPGMTIVCGDSHTSHPRRVRRARLRHRHQRGRARAGHPDAAAVRPKTMAVTVAGELPAGRHRQGPDPGDHRQDRHRRRPGPHRRVPRRGHPRALHGGPA